MHAEIELNCIIIYTKRTHTTYSAAGPADKNIQVKRITIVPSCRDHEITVWGSVVTHVEESLSIRKTNHGCVAPFKQLCSTHIAWAKKVGG